MNNRKQLNKIIDFYYYNFNESPICTNQSELLFKLNTKKTDYLKLKDSESERTGCKSKERVRRIDSLYLLYINSFYT